MKKLRTNRVGDEMIRRMFEQNCYVVLSLDGLMSDVGSAVGVKLYRGMREHPLNRARVASDWLARDDRFEVGLTRAHDTNGRSRALRSFHLKTGYSPEKEDCDVAFARA